MVTIRGKLLRAFLGVIAALSLASLLFLALSFYLTQQYKSISDVMIAEYQLVDNAALLIDAYNRRVQSEGAESIVIQEQLRIAEAEKKISELMDMLDARTFDTQSTSDYRGFKASIERFTSHINESIRRFEEENLKDYFVDYNEANKQYGFVRENGTTALFSQLKYATALREQIEKTYRVSIMLGLALLLTVIASCTIFVMHFSHRLVAPLAALSSVAEKIAAGDTTIKIDPNLIGSSIEIRSLAQSFGTMVIRLLENIAKVDASNKELEKSSKALTTQNDEFARLNRLMMDRELKMIELKKEIEQLKAGKS